LIAFEGSIHMPAETQSLADLVRHPIQAIRADPPVFDQPATPDGAQRIAAVGGLLRATRLLEDALVCARNGADEALLLVLRTLVEININVRYLLTHGQDGLKQLVANQERRRLAVANALFGPDDLRCRELEANIDEAELPPERPIAVLAAASPLGELAYNGVYRWLSSSSAHGGTQSWEPYWFEIGEQLRGVFRPQLDPSRDEALTTAALVVGGLASVVFGTLGLSLPSGWEDLASAFQALE
jgi:Family of unknown function (DUF5677)